MLRLVRPLLLSLLVALGIPSLAAAQSVGNGTPVPCPTAGANITITGTTMPACSIAGSSSGPAFTTFDATVEATSGITHYWPMNDIAGSTAAADVIGATNLALNGNTTFGLPGFVRDGETMAQIPQNTTSETDFFTFPNGTMPGSGAFSFMIAGMWGGNRNSMQNQLTNYTIFSMDTSNNFVIQCNSSWNLVTNGGATQQPILANCLGPYVRFIIFVTWDGTNLKAYINNLQAMSITPPRPTQGSAGAIGRWANTTTQGAYNGWVEKVAVWNVAINTTTINSIYVQF